MRYLSRIDAYLYHMTQKEIIDLMKTSRSHLEWNSNAQKVMDQNAGRLPDWWYDELIASGIKAMTVG